MPIETGLFLSARLFGANQTPWQMGLGAFSLSLFLSLYLYLARIHTNIRVDMPLENGNAAQDFDFQLVRAVAI